MRKLFRNTRVLFVQDGCPKCRPWKEFIERENAKLPLNRQIKIIDCSKYNHYGIVTDPLIRVFDRLIDGYPILFIDGQRMDGTNTREEAEAWLKAMLHEDYTIPEYNPYMFNKDCRFVKKRILGRLIQCG